MKKGRRRVLGEIREAAVLSTYRIYPLWAPEEEQNFSTLLEMLNAMEVSEDDEEFKNPVDLMFDELEEKDPDHFAVRQYKKYKLAAGKTAEINPGILWCKTCSV